MAIDPEALELLSEMILIKIMEPMVHVIKDSVHVWSGRQQRTVDFSVQGNSGNITIGSDEPLWGKVVNYVIIEEFKHSRIRSTAIPLIFSLLRQGVLLDYQRKTTDATKPIR